MNRRITVALALFVLMNATVCPAAADRGAECVALVDKAVAFVQEKGTDYAIKTFCCSKGPFIDKELYVFALSMDNIMLAHPWKSSLIGKNLDDYTDEKGTYVFREFKNVAANQGSGWVDYWWWLPGESEQVPKRSFIKRVPGTDMYLGAGYYPDKKKTAAGRSQ